jgi:hypothetical protein
MNKNKIIYWSTTGIVAAIMAWSAVNFSFNGQMRAAFAHLGLPDWFRIELTVAKLLGVVALIVPATPARLKEFAYFGFALTIVSACVAHISSDDGILRGLEPLVFLGFLTISYLYYHKGRKVEVNSDSPTAGLGEALPQDL